MTTFNMYVKTVIRNEQNKVLLLKQKREDNKQHWDLPGSTFTEEQSFDETVITNVQKEIGYYVYPGKIIGLADFTSEAAKEVHVIMDGIILNGELLLSKDYETYVWVDLSRIKDYPLVPWLHNYINSTKHPFEDVESEIEELTSKRPRRRKFFHEDIKSSFGSKNKKEKTTEKTTENTTEKRKSSFSILKDTIKKTFHPKQVTVKQTTPKPNSYSEVEDSEVEDKIESKFNFRKRKDEPTPEYIKEAIVNNTEEDIIIEHNDTPESDTVTENVVQEDIIIEQDSNDIIIEHETVVEENKVEKLPKKEEVEKTIEKEGNKKKFFDMNVNKQGNMKEKTVKEEPEIKIIHEDEKTPHIRTEKEDKERVSFSSDLRHGWKERLNKINRTEANNYKKEAPRPKGQRK